MQLPRTTGREREQGFMLMGVMVLVFLAMLALSVAAPKVAKNCGGSAR